MKKAKRLLIGWIQFLLGFLGFVALFAIPSSAIKYVELVLIVFIMSIALWLVLAQE